jgi:hypothetical protein
VDGRDKPGHDGKKETRGWSAFADHDEKGQGAGVDETEWP